MAAPLTSRQHECLALAAEGLTYKQIAHRLGLAHSTVRSHLHAAYGKLGVANGPQAIATFAAKGLLGQIRHLRGEMVATRLLLRAFDAVLDDKPGSAERLREVSRVVLREHGFPERNRPSPEVALDRLLDTLIYGDLDRTGFQRGAEVG